MVLAHADEREADPIGELGLLDQVAEHLGVRFGLAVCGTRAIAERIETNLELCHAAAKLTIEATLRQGPGLRAGLGAKPATMPISHARRTRRGEAGQTETWASCYEPSASSGG